VTPGIKVTRGFSPAPLYNYAPPVHVAPRPRKSAPQVHVPPLYAARYDAAALAFTAPPRAPGYYTAPTALAAQPLYDYGAGYWGREGFWGATRNEA
jgi:hypothetical protein